MAAIKHPVRDLIWVEERQKHSASPRRGETFLPVTGQRPYEGVTALLHFFRKKIPFAIDSRAPVGYIIYISTTKTSCMNNQAAKTETVRNTSIGCISTCPV